MIKNINKLSRHEKQKNIRKLINLALGMHITHLTSYRRKINPDKLEPKWQGPFNAESVSASKNYAI